MTLRYKLMLTSLALMTYDVTAMLGPLSRRRSTGGTSPSSKSTVCSDAELEAKLDFVENSAQNDPCLRIQTVLDGPTEPQGPSSRSSSTPRRSNSTGWSRSCSSNSSLRTMDPTDPRSSAINEAKNACIDAGVKYLELPSSYKLPCQNATGAKCVKKQGVFGCYVTIPKKIGGFFPTTTTVKYSDCADLVKIYKARQRLAVPLRANNRRRGSRSSPPPPPIAELEFA